MAVNVAKNPKYPAYSMEYMRWPPALKLRPDQLSGVDFVYTQLGDRVICCGACFCDWKENDISWCIIVW